ncbi:MAG: isoprenyl transferase [Marinilabiliaceae bacterium]|nr:isoprenyl transferase [Marinilabiliaceae bacterium]
MSVKEKLDIQKMPRHVAIIMDGNGRWAKKKGAVRMFGHKQGVETVHQITEAATELGLQYLTLYVFSTENWNRPKTEINALMSLLVSTITKETKTLLDNNIILKTIGNINNLPSKVRKELELCMLKTEKNTGLTLILALSYSSRWEITEAAKKIAEDVKNGNLQIDTINEQLFQKYLTTKTIPDPELLIRTSGELRISNFLLWQVAYSELFFTEVLWPDFSKEHFYEALFDYQKRERRFGKTSEQLKL